MRIGRNIAALVAVSLGAGLTVTASPDPAQAQPPRTIRRPDTPTPGVVRGIREAARKGKPVDVARGFLARDRDLFRIDVSDLRLQTVERSRGQVHVRFSQSHGGHPVFGATYSVHLENEGSAYSPDAANGAYFPGLDAPTTPSLDEAAARRYARAFSRLVEIDSIASHGLTVLPEGGGVLTYHFTVAGSRLGRPVKLETFIDASNGSLALSYNNLHSVHGPESVPATTSAGSGVTVDVFHDGDDVYRLFDQVRNIRTFDARGRSNYLPKQQPSNVTSTDGVFDVEGRASGANDAHYNTMVAYDFYDALGYDLGIIHPDGRIISTVNVGDRSSPDGELYNAFWTSAPQYQMVYGNPGGDLRPISAALDVVAHELTHGMSEALVGGPGLIYMNQSGAMNEAYSDYVGEAVEKTMAGAMGDADSGQVGEDVCINPTPLWPCPLREMDPQPADPDMTDAIEPDDYPHASGYHHLLMDMDLGGVHENSVPYSGALWDIRKDFFQRDGQAGADRFDGIVLAALDTYTHPLSTFVEGNADLLLAADLLGASQDDKDAINDAFARHGIVANWTTPASLDGRALMNDVAPLNLGFAAPQRSGNRFIIGDYKNKKKVYGPLELYVGRTDCARCRKIKVGESGNFFTFSDENPDISGKRAVYAHLDLFGDANVRTQVAGERKKKTVAGGRGLQWFPSIDKAGKRGQLVAWEHVGCRSCDTDIKARFLGKKPKNVISDRRREQIMPTVSGRWVAWWDLGRNYAGRPRVGVRNVVTGKKIVFKPPTKRTFMGPPSMSDSHLYWYQDTEFYKKGSNGKGTIMRVKLGRSRARALFGQNAAKAPRYLGYGAPPIPSANRRFVTWHDETKLDWAGDPAKLAQQDEVGRDVMFLRLGTRSIKVLTDNRGDQAYPVIGEGWRRSILWLDGSRARTDVRISP